MTDFNDYISTCPACGGQLIVVNFCFNGRVPLRIDGFDVGSAKEANTENEIVECGLCGFRIDGLPMGEGWHIIATSRITPREGYMHALIDVVAITMGEEDHTPRAIQVFEHWLPNRMHSQQGLRKLACLLADEHAERVNAISWEVETSDE